MGDPIWPGPQLIRVPRLRGGADSALRGYPLHMVYAEKIVTAIQRGVSNTRWRDYGDMWVLSRRHPVSGDRLQQAITEVARYREAHLTLLADELAGYPALAQTTWIGWLQRSGSELPTDFDAVFTQIILLADPALAGQVQGKWWDPDRSSWQTHQ